MCANMFIMDTFFWKYTGCWEYDMIYYLQNPLILVIFIYSHCYNFQVILITIMKELAQMFRPIFIIMSSKEYRRQSLTKAVQLRINI